MKYKGTLAGNTYGTGNDAVTALLNKTIRENEYYEVSGSEIVNGNTYYYKDETGTYVEFTAAAGVTHTPTYAKTDVQVGDTYRLTSSMNTVFTST